MAQQTLDQIPRRTIQTSWMQVGKPNRKKLQGARTRDELLAGEADAIPEILTWYAEFSDLIPCLPGSFS